jgi:hypothetical protein
VVILIPCLSRDQVGANGFGGEYFSEADVEWRLKVSGAIPSKMEEDPRAGKGTRVSVLTGKPLAAKGRKATGDSESDSDSDDSDWD